MTEPACLEPLEARIAPATLTFTDVDGDLVTVKTSRGSNAELDAAVVRDNSGEGSSITSINLNGATFAGTSLSVTAKRAADGDGSVNVGDLFSNQDLGSVVLDGDLFSGMAVGDANAATQGLKSLTVQSIGRFKLSVNPLFSVTGDLGKLTVRGDVTATVQVINGDAGAIFIGGSVLGGSLPGVGNIQVFGSIGSVKIGGNLEGGEASTTSGAVIATGDIGKVEIGGSLIGRNDDSGTVRTNGSIGSIKIGHDVVANGGNSGRISAQGALGSVVIGGSLIGGVEEDAGQISSGGDITSIKIGGDVIGGTGNTTGLIFSDTGTIGSLFIGGSLIGGAGGSSGSIDAEAIGKAVIRGDLRAGEGSGADSSGSIEVPSIASLVVGGSLIGGDAPDTASIKAGGFLGSLLVKGDLRGGNGDDSASILSSEFTPTKSITIGGSLFGNVGDRSASIDLINGAAVKVLGAVIGGSGQSSGSVDGGGAGGPSSIFIGRGVQGGSGDFSGGIGRTDSLFIGGDVEGAAGIFSGAIGGGRESTVIRGSLLGGFGTGSGSLDNASANFQAIFIGGDVKGGAGANSGTIGALTIETLTVRGSLIGGFAGGQIAIGTLGKSLTIGGNIEAGINSRTGIVAIANAAGSSLAVGGSLIGGTGSESGRIEIDENMISLRIGGSILGGSGLNSGTVFNEEEFNTVFIGGSLVGGAGAFSGSLDFEEATKTFTLGGSIVGGTGSNSGSVEISESKASSKILIGGDIRGGSASGSTSLENSGFLEVESAASLTINGSIFAGTDATSGFFGNNGAVRAQQGIGSLTIKGSVVGNSTNAVLITAGTSNDFAQPETSFGAITIGGRVEFARLLGGYDDDGTTIDGSGGESADALIGKVTVGGDWVASSLAAGADDGGNGFGNANDAPLSGIGVTNDPAILSRIASIVIKGRVIGTTSSSTDFFGFVADEILAFKAGKIVFPLNPGIENDGFLIGTTGDVRVLEVGTDL